MEKCKICNTELKLDLYNKVYFCPNCLNNTEYDFVFIYRELNDFSKPTEEIEIVKKLKVDLKDKSVAENKICKAKKMVIFASKSSYLFSFRKYFQSFNGEIILITKNLYNLDLPLELRGFINYSFNDSNIIEHLLEIKNEKIEDIKEINDYHKYYELLSEGRFTQVSSLVNSDLLNNIENSEIYLIKLLAQLNIKNINGLHLYIKTPLSNFTDFKKAYELGNDKLKLKLDEILSLQQKEIKYQKAKIRINELTVLPQIDLSIKILKEIDPYKDSSALINYYLKEKDRFIFNRDENKKTYNLPNRNKTALKTVLYIICYIIIFSVCLMLFMSGLFREITAFFGAISLICIILTISGIKGNK